MPILRDVREFVLEVLHNKVAVAGIALILPFIVMALFAPFLTNYDPMKVGSPEEVLMPPCREHILGTDDLGRDVWSQLVYGARVSMIVGLLATVMGVGLGTLVGLFSGYYKGVVGEVLMRATDIVMVIPTLPLMMVLAALLGPSIWNIILVIAVTGWPYCARVVRSQVLSVKERPFVEAARCVGVGDFSIIFKEIFPSVLPIAFAEAVLWIASAIYSEAVLSFLGLGDPMHVSWGMMLRAAFTSGAMAWAWWWILPPGMSIAFLVLGFTFLGNAVQEITNPKLRHM